MPLRFGRWRFSPGIVTTLAAALFIALTVALGNWQVRRAAEKTELRERIDAGASAPPQRLPPSAVNAADYVWRHVEVRGTFDDEHTIYLDNRINAGRVGYDVITPLRIEGGARCVLVNRGWVAAGPSRAELPVVPVPRGEQAVAGIAMVPPSKVFELGEQSPSSRIWQNLILERYARWSGLDIAPVVLQQTNDAGDGLERHWHRPDLNVERHQAYAGQWYSLAALTFILYVALNLKRQSGDERPPRQA